MSTSEIQFAEEQEPLTLIIKECDKVLNTLKPYQLLLVNEKVDKTLKSIKP